MENHFGKCALCRKECDLSFEHIPPRAAFNSKPVKVITGEKIINDPDRMPWETEGLEYSDLQRGMGVFSLCSTCNSITACYGTTYKRVARVVDLLLTKPIPENNDSVIISNIFPLRFIKQVISMFCSINNVDDGRLSSLRQFVLEQRKTGLDKSHYKLCMYFTRSKYCKHAPISVVIREIDSNPIAVAVSEITAYPLGFVLYFNPTDTVYYDGVDITGFADFGYDEKVSIAMPICILEMNDLFPTLYRTQEEIKQTVEENKEWVRLNAHAD